MSKCVHGNEGVKVVGCGRCRDELVTSRALCRALGASPAEVLRVLQMVYGSDAEWKVALAAARAELEAEGVNYTRVVEGPVTVGDVAGLASARSGVVA